MKFSKALICLLSLASWGAPHALSQQQTPLPEIVKDGQRMYAPTIPFFNINLQGNCTGPACGSGGGGSLPTTTFLLKGDGAGGAVAASPTNCGAGAATGIAASGNPSGCISPFTISLPASANLLADYQLADGTGTAPSDSSGNGNTGSFPGGGANPTWTNQGLSFDGTTGGSGQYFLSTGTQTAKTIMTVYSMTAPLHNNGPQNPTYYTLWGTPLLSGLLFNSYSQGYGRHMGLDQNGTTFSMAEGTHVGTHCSVVVLGTGGGNVDHIYLDGNEVTIAGAGSTYGLANADYSVGGSNSGYDTYFTGSIYRWSAWSTQLTAAQAAFACGNAEILAESRGVRFSFFPPPTNTTAVNQFIATGDSLTNGNGATPYTSFLSTAQTFNIQNFGVGGITGLVNQSLFPYREQLYFAPYAPVNINYIWNGVNDVTVYGESPAQTWAAIAGQCSLAKRLGFRAIASTLISVTGAGNDALRDSANALIRGQGLSYCDAISDVAADPNIGADGAYSNTTYFQGDGVHLVTSAQQNEVAPIASHAVDWLTGSSLIACDPVIVTASTYTSVAADGCKVFNAASNAITDTLPSAMGYTGRVIRRCNQSSGSNAVTIAAPSDFDFNNDGATTTVTVPNKSCKDFRATLVSASAGGDYWQQIN